MDSVFEISSDVLITVASLLSVDSDSVTVDICILNVVVDVVAIAVGVVIAAVADVVTVVVGILINVSGGVAIVIGVVVVVFVGVVKVSMGTIGVVVRLTLVTVGLVVKMVRGIVGVRPVEVGVKTVGMGVVLLDGVETALVVVIYVVVEWVTAVAFGKNEDVVGMTFVATCVTKVAVGCIL